MLSVMIRIKSEIFHKLKKSQNYKAKKVFSLSSNGKDTI